MSTSRINTEEFIGYKVGSLTVVEFLEEKWLPSGERYDHYYLCRCDCGMEGTFIRRVLKSTAVVKRNTICCQQCQKNKLKNNRIAIKYDNDIDRHAGVVYSNYKSKCKAKGWEFELSFNQFRDLLLQNCWYCGLEPSNCRGKNGPKGTSRKHFSGIDRVDNSKGYTKHNVRPCCEDCNKAKRELNEVDFLDLIKRIYKNLSLDT